MRAAGLLSLLLSAHGAPSAAAAGTAAAVAGDGRNARNVRVATNASRAPVSASGCEPACCTCMLNTCHLAREMGEAACMQCCTLNAGVLAGSGCSCKPPDSAAWCRKAPGPHAWPSGNQTCPALGCTCGLPAH